MGVTNKEVIYITGHRNPDLDSVCSAYAYAVLKNTIDPGRQYVPIRCGHLNANSKKIFASLGIIPPPYMRDIYPKVKDVVLTTRDNIQADACLNEVADTYSDSKPSVIPIFDGDSFYGLLSVIHRMQALFIKNFFGFFHAFTISVLFIQSFFI